MAGRLLQGVRGMRDSLTYQAVLDEGRAEGEARRRAAGRLEEARRLLRQLGERRFGRPNATIGARIDGLAEVDQVERVTVRLLDAASWEDALVETPGR